MAGRRCRALFVPTCGRRCRALFGSAPVVARPVRVGRRRWPVRARACRGWRRGRKLSDEAQTLRDAIVRLDAILNDTQLLRQVIVMRTGL